jgi:glycosyltransferase involved in cell wall biosynthesis
VRHCRSFRASAETVGTPSGDRVAFVLKGYPRLSETFIAQEIRALEVRGLDILIVSLRRPTDKRTHTVHAEVRAPILYLPEYLHRGPFRVLCAWWKVRRWPSYRNVRGTWLRDLRRDFSASRFRRFGQALVLASELPASVGRLHAHFLHTPSSVTRYAAAFCGLPWSGSAHAKDIWTTPEWDLREKLASCAWLVTCTATNCEHLKHLAPRGRVELVYHGLDLERFPPIQIERPPRTGKSEDDGVVILSVGRLVEKKGTDVLLDALALLPANLHWRLVHVGGGPLGRELRRRAEKLGISTRIAWRGALTQSELLAEYRAADIFALASKIAPDGDRDGLPNVLMEAQTQGLPCVATEVSAIHELVERGVTGLLVAPESPNAFAAALAELIADPIRRGELGGAGRNRVLERFGMNMNIGRLAGKFGLADTGEVSQGRR